MTFTEPDAGVDIDWDEVLVVPQFAGGFVVIVRGIASAPTSVSLEPGPEEPSDYAPVHVVGRRASVVIQVESPWEVQCPLDQLPSGRVGTVLIGATKRHHIPPVDPTGAPY